MKRKKTFTKIPERETKNNFCSLSFLYFLQQIMSPRSPLGTSVSPEIFAFQIIWKLSKISYLFLLQLSHHLCSNVTIPTICISLYLDPENWASLLFSSNWILVCALSLGIHHAHLLDSSNWSAKFMIMRYMVNMNGWKVLTLTQPAMFPNSQAWIGSFTISIAK